MVSETVLYISDHGVSTSVLGAIKDVGYDVVIADKANQAMALLFVMHSAAAVLLDLRSTEKIGFEFARELRAIHSGVPIILRCCEHIDHLPAWIDAQVSAGEPLESLELLLRKMLDGESVIHDTPISARLNSMS